MSDGLRSKVIKKRLSATEAFWNACSSFSIPFHGAIVPDQVEIAMYSAVVLGGW
jgi:hypothetical protein